MARKYAGQLARKFGGNFVFIELKCLQELQRKRLLLLLIMMMEDEELPISYERKMWARQWLLRREQRGAFHTLFQELPTVCSICSLSGVDILKHERAELWELKMLISDWFIFNWSQGPVPRTCSHEGPSKILRGPLPATGLTNSNQFEFLGPISGTKIQSLRPDF